MSLTQLLNYRWDLDLGQLILESHPSLLRSGKKTAVKEWRLRWNDGKLKVSCISFYLWFHLRIYLRTYFSFQIKHFFIKNSEWDSEIHTGALDLISIYCWISHMSQDHMLSTENRDKKMIPRKGEKKIGNRLSLLYQECPNISPLFN